MSAGSATDAGSTADPLEVERSGAVARLHLNRPGKRNALSAELCRRLSDTLSEFESDPGIRVIVIDGRGPSFCAGADLSVGNVAESGRDWASRRRDQGSWQRILQMLDRLPQVTVAALHGHVVGGGALLAAACDIRIAATGTEVRIPELALDIPLTWGGVPLLVREIGLPLTRDWVLSGRHVDSEELLRCGFAQHVVPDADVSEAVDAYVANLLALSPPVLAMTRSLTSALGRTHSAQVAGWADADLLQWSLEENRTIPER